jgi:hypothetical protein
MITEDRQVRDSHTGTMWAAGDEPVFKDTIKLGYIHGVTHQNLVCRFLPSALAKKVKRSN